MYGVDFAVFGVSVVTEAREGRVDELLREAVEDVIAEAMDSVMDRVLHESPFDMERRRRESPLHAALVPEDIFKGSHFERRFVTIFGTVWEKLVAAIGKATFGFAATQHMVVGCVRQGRLDRIQQTLDQLEHPRSSGERIGPDWQTELDHVLAGAGPLQDVSVNCDVYVATDAETPGFAFELKSAWPNSDQTKVSKEKLLKLLCMEPRAVEAAYFALPYNPYGSRQDYGWSPPKRWFDMVNDPCVLIGDELWNKIGGEGTSQEVLEIAKAVGRRYREKIYNDYLHLPLPRQR